ncbi:hypothetical protein LCGC14_1885320 [marine sediment metagenome]|uniref:Uncharacterized protein n=1 Tax=marine sediment metagenome TaxID=412755 RepID=A0A0F9IF05_9ZZZZ
MVNWDGILDSALDKKEIEKALESGPILIPESDMKDGDWTGAQVLALVVNPVYAGVGPYPQIIDDGVWISAVAKQIERIGAHLILRVLLDSLRQTFEEGNIG